MRNVVHVLYAEDDPSDVDLTRSRLARIAPEFELQVVHRAQEFVVAARTRRHAIFLIDQRLPDGSGLEVLKQLAQEHIDTPAIFVTGGGDRELASQALQLGAVDYIPKRPGYLDSLPNHLREILQRRKQTLVAARPRVSPRRVLLLDDSSSQSALLVQQLTRFAPHLSFEVVSSIPAMVTSLQTAVPGIDLVISCRRPPKLNTFESISEARRKGWHTPFIILAQTGTEEEVVAAFKQGASDYVLSAAQRPVELALRIDLAIDRHELALASERAATELAARQQMLAALRESEKQLNLALEAGRIGLWSWRVGSDETQFSSRWKAQIGFSDNEIRNDRAEWESRCHPDDLESMKRITARYLAAPWPDFSLEYRLRHKNGCWRWFLSHADLETDPQGRPFRLLGSQIDITTLKDQQAEIATTSARLQQLSRRLLEVQETERRSIARELHDEIGQVLTVAKMHLRGAAMSPDPDTIAAQVKEPIALLDRLLAQVRSLSLNLRPPVLDDLGLVAALRWLLHQQQARSNVPRVSLSADPALDQTDPMVTTACFRIAQEALTNALRHARSKNIQIALETRDRALRLNVRDDGVGFDITAARARAERGASLGILGMHERALLAGGKLTIRSSKEDGTNVEAVFPLSPNSNPA
jgi:PAS domain S-box-containing protein